MNVDNPLEEPFSIKWTKSDKEPKYMSLFQNLAFSANPSGKSEKRNFEKVFLTIIPALRQKISLNNGYTSNVVLILEA